LIEEVYLSADHLEPQAFFASFLDMDSLDLTALDTLQYCLSGNA